jgi:peptide/nickel transport system substrate-binding protein
VFEGMYTATAQAISPVSPYHVDSIVPPARDVAKAKALLEAAGVKTPIDVSLSIFNDPLSRQVAEVLQSMTAEAGFNLKIVAMETGSAISALTSGDYQVFQVGWSGLLDPDSNIWQWLHTGGPLNDGGYSNAKLDALLEAARTTDDVAKRRDLYGEVWKIVQVEEPFVFLWTTSNIAGMKASVKGYRSLPDGLVRLQGVSIAQ